MRACVLACLATAATATRVLSGGGLPFLKPRTFGRRAVLPVPAADKTMTVGDDRKHYLDNYENRCRDLLAENERTGVLPNDLPDEFDWPAYDYPGAKNLIKFVTTADMASLGLRFARDYRFPPKRF